MSGLDLTAVLTHHRIVLCGGSGGVGKTTTAAALGIAAARLGRRTLVMTIDPAKRLANAMGLDAISPEPQPIPDIPGLSAMMLDAGDTFDGLIKRFAKDEASGQSILDNPYYQQISATVAGSREFMAMEKLQQLTTDERFDLLIVDTPPTQNALDFIDSPRRLIELLDGSGLGLIMRATNVANRMSFGLLGRGQDQFAKFIELLTGYRVVGDLNAFFRGFSEIIDTFRERARKLQATLRGDDATFLMVLRPEAPLVAASQRYAKRLAAESMSISGVVVNQLLELPGEHVPVDVPSELAERIARCTERWTAVAEADSRALQAVQDGVGVPVTSVRRLPGNVSTLADLDVIASELMQNTES